MNRTNLSRALNASGVMGATLATVATIGGLVGVLASTPSFCPERIGPARCRASASQFALIAAYGLTAAGAAGLLMAAGKLADPEA